MRKYEHMHFFQKSCSVSEYDTFLKCEILFQTEETIGQNSPITLHCKSKFP